MTLTFDLLTWMSIGIIYSSRTIYLPSLKLQGQSVPELSVAQGLIDWHDLWPWTYWPDYQYGSCTHQGLSTYQVWSFWGKALLSYPLHKVWKTAMTFDLDLWPTDLTIDRDHLLIKDYLPTKFEASVAKRCWVIRCTRFERLTWPLTLTFDLLTWLSIGIIFSSRTIYLPSLKLQSVVELSVAQGLRDWHDLWPTDLTINRDHLLIKDYLPTKFEASGTKRCWVIRCTRFGRLTWPLTLTFGLLTWLSIGVIYSSRTIYLPRLKLLGQSVVELSVAQGLRDWHDLWPWPLTYWPDYQ